MRALFAWVGLASALAGTTLWFATRPATPPPMGGTVPGALMAATFKDLENRPHSLAELQGKVVVLNFWATWCAPCREEMPGFERLQARWASRGVTFVGVSSEEPGKVAAFARSLGITYSLWVGGDEVNEMSHRLGNGQGVLPHTVVLDGSGISAEARVGAYPERELEDALVRLTSKTR